MICVVVGPLWPASVSADTTAAGAQHSVVVTPDGHVWTWGHGDYGQLGHNSSATRTVPGEVAGVTDVVAVAAGLYHTLALKADGTVWAWGEAGRTGDGTSIRRYAPVHLAITDVVKIAAGGNHSAAIKSDGSVWLWGQNLNGQVGDGTNALRLSPTLVTAWGTASDIALGWDHTMVLRTDGTVWTAGGNWSGELGNGNTTHQWSPVQMTAIAGATRIAGGRGVSLVLKSNQTLWVAGYNGHGQLGTGQGPNQSVAVQIASLSNVVAMSAGEYHVIAVTASGAVWGWGDNPDGRVGDGTTTRQYAPVPALGPSSIDKVTVGQSHSLAVTTDGTVWVWGHNGQGRLGDGTTLTPPSPMTISGPNYTWMVGTPTFSVGSGTYTNNQTVVIASATPGAEIHYTLDGNEPTEADPTVASGGSVVIDTPRTLKARAWKPSTPPSGVTTATYAMVVATPTFSPVPTTYTTPQTVTLSSVTSGATIHYTTDGSPATTSSPTYTGAIGLSTSTTIRAIGVRTEWTDSNVGNGMYTMRFGTLAAPTFTQATGTYTSFVSVTISAAGGAAIRYTTNGSTPTETSPLYIAPLEVTTTTTLKAKAFHPDYYTSPMTTGTYTIQVGAPTFSLASGTHPAGTPIVVSSPTPGATTTYTLQSIDPVQTDPTIASGGSLVVGTFVLKAKAWKTGATPSTTTTATYAVMGTSAAPMIDGNYTFSVALRSDGTIWQWGTNSVVILPPAMVPGLTGMTAVDAGGSHVLAIRGDGTVVAWGVNQGRLGDGTTADRWMPGPVTGLTEITAVAGGKSHSVARRSDGTVWTWGVNEAGELGNGNTAPQLTPVQVTGLTDVVAIAAGYQFTVAVKSDGTVWTWGTASYGVLGDGSTTPRSTPGQVPGLTGVTSVAAGLLRIFARKSDGTILGWGSGMTLTPSAVSGLPSIAALAAGTGHALALAADGLVWSWGKNDFAQLGDGTVTSRATPAAITGLSSVIAIGAGDRHSFAVDADHVVWAWGDNYTAQLGDLTFSQRRVPTAISGPGMNWKVHTPTLNVASGTYDTPQHVVVTCGDQDLPTTLHYTNDGVDPTESEPSVACGGTVVVTTSQTLKVRGWRPGAPASEIARATYALKVVTPTLQPASGTYATPQTVTLSTSTPDVTFRYTLDGSEPTETSAAYTGALVVSGAVTLRIRAFKTDWVPSDVAQQSYWISEGPVQPPTFEPAGGTYADVPWVTLSSPTPGVTIRYTTDGSTPTLQSRVYRYPFLVPTSATIQARAFKGHYTPSTVTSASYIRDAAGATTVPTIAPGGGTYTSGPTVTITGLPEATLRYTTTGIDPTETDTVIASGGTIVIDRSLPLKVRAWQVGATPSAVQRADYHVTGMLAGGGGHSLALKADGTVWAWGDNLFGQLGDGTNTGRTTPVQVSGLTNVVAIAAGGGHSLAVKRDGTVWAWGWNYRYQLGDGTPSDRRSPVQVSGLTDVVAVAAGGEHSLALKADGTVWGWGNGWSGQVGDGSLQVRATPVQVAGLAHATRIAANEHTSYAIDGGGAALGALWAWGVNQYGQIGDGGTASRHLPVRVPLEAPAAEVLAGGRFAAVILEDGRLRLWGLNQYTQLAGASSEAWVSSPVASTLLHAAAAAALGGGHGVFIGRLDGRVWTWGDNGAGQTGQTTYPLHVASPYPILAIAGWTATGLGGAHSLIADAGGAVWSVGFNNSGQLGNGTLTSTNAFAKITGFTLAANTWLTTDPDGDGLPTWREFLLHTDPLVMDTNGDGIPDGPDVDAGRVPDNTDADGDGLSNWAEAQRGTDPFNPDSDGDLVNDRLDPFPLDPTRSSLPPPDPNDHTPPVITLIEPTNARLVP